MMHSTRLETPLALSIPLHRKAAIEKRVSVAPTAITAAVVETAVLSSTRSCLPVLQLDLIRRQKLNRMVVGFYSGRARQPRDYHQQDHIMWHRLDTSRGASTGSSPLVAIENYKILHRTPFASAFQLPLGRPEQALAQTSRPLLSAVTVAAGSARPTKDKSLRMQSIWYIILDSLSGVSAVTDGTCAWRKNEKNKSAPCTGTGGNQTTPLSERFTALVRIARLKRCSVIVTWYVGDK